MNTEIITNCTFRKIVEDEFDKLHDLFPDNEQMWIKYRSKRLREFGNKETDVYVIEENSIFIGELSINYTSHDLAMETVPNQRVYLQAFRVDEKYQGLGLGQKLLQFALSDLKRQGYTEFTIGVEEDNEIAKHIYFKFGFAEDLDHGRGDQFDPTHDTLYMRSIRNTCEKF